MRFISVLFIVLCFLPVETMALPVPTLVSPQWLSKNLQNPQLAIIEVSDEASFIFEGHIPGSANTNKSDWRYADNDNSLLHYSPVELQRKTS